MAAHRRQQEFLNLTCHEALYGGAAGGGKTEALLMWLAQGVEVKDYSGLFLRRTFPQLNRSNDSPILRSARIYKPLGGVYHTGDHRWVFPSGAIIEFGHMQYEASVMDYQGPSYHRVAYDELTQFSETQYKFMFSRIRKHRGFPISLGVRAATNPGGPGHEWVKKHFIPDEAKTWLKRLTYHDPSPMGSIFWTSPTRAFVPARVADNPTLDVEDYIQNMLAHLPLKLREQMASGDWDAIEGSLIDPEWFMRYTVNGEHLVAMDKHGQRAWSRDRREMRRFATIDTAGTSEERAQEKRGKAPAYSVVLIWDFDPKTKSLFLRHVWRARVDWLELKRGVRSTLEVWRPRKVLIENAHFGPSLASELRSGFEIELKASRIPEMQTSNRGAKLERAIAADLFEVLQSHRFRLPEAGLVPGVDAWLPDYERELCVWTGDPEEVCDQIDATSYATAHIGGSRQASWGGVVTNGSR
jgi:hypothetical protein